MSIIRRNIIANVAGRGWSAFLSVAIIPLYIHFVGIEAYGLIGFFLSLMSILSLLDLGLGTALNREFANTSAKPGNEQRMHDLLHTLERVYWLIGVAIAVVLAALAPAIAAYWITPQQLAAETVTEALMLMSISIAFQWPRALYSGGMMGLQRQVSLNLLISATGTVNSIGGVLVLWLISPSILALIAWSMAVSIVDVVLTRLLLTRSLPPAPRRPAFSRTLLGEIWRFAAGMTGISVLSVIVTQADKIILSKVLSLESFGYYSLASRLAAGLYYLIGPISAAFFPRFSQLLQSKDFVELARLYHRGCQLISVTVLPITLVVAMFAWEILVLWTRNEAIAANCRVMLAVLTVGTAINGLMNLPVTLQLVSGDTRPVLYAHTIAAILMVPIIYFASTRFGGEGAAWAWLTLNCGYVAVLLPIIQRRLLPGHTRDWFIQDVGGPLAATIAVAGLWRLAAGTLDSSGWMLFYLAGVSLAAPLAAAFAAPQIRALILHHLFDKARRGIRPQ